MKKTTKVILSSALTMGLCASLIAGSTLAMFSSRSNVNVAITSGKVDVVASVDTDSLTGYSTMYDTSAMEYVQKPVTELGKPAGTFYAGGTYTYDAGELKLDSIAPGDAVEFQLNIENKSTLAIQYRVQLTVPTENQNGEAQENIVKELKVSFNDEDPVAIGDTSTFAQPWSKPVDKGVAIEETPKVRVELPYELGNDYQGQSCLLHVGVYAVQLGTHTANTYGTYNIYTGSDFLKLVNGNMYQVGSFKGETIALMNDIDLDPNAADVSTLSLALADAPMPIAAVQSELNWDSEFQGTLDGNGFTISNFKSVEVPMGMGADMPKGFINTTRNATIRNLIISDAAISFNSQNVGTSNRYKYNQGGTLVGVAYGTLTVENVVIKNSTVKSTTNYTSKCGVGGAGGKNTKTKEEALQNNQAWNSYPLVGYDVIGALIGRVSGNTTISNVKVTLNETSAELTGAEQIKDYKEEVLRQFKGNKLIGEINGSVTYVGNTTLDCISEDGMDENMIFNTENGGVSEPSLLVKSAEALASLSQSEKDYTDVTIKLAEDIVFNDEEINTAGFVGTIDGDGHTISGLKLNYFSAISGLAMAASVGEVPTLKNITLEFTEFTDIENWKTQYAYAAQSDNFDAFLDAEKVTLENAKIALLDEDLRFEMIYDETGNRTKVSYIGLRDGNPETGEGYTEINNDYQTPVDDSIDFINVKFTGNSYLWIQAGGITLTLDRCYIDVDPARVGNNSRAAFIASTSEIQDGITFNLTDNTFLSAHSSADGFSAAIFSWAYTASSLFKDNRFGNADNRYNFVAVKLMNFVDGANIEFTNNTVYGTSEQYYFDAFDLMQNNSRANKYTATFKSNKVNAINGSYGFAHFLWVEANLTSEQNPGHGQVLVTSDNYMFYDGSETGTAIGYDQYDPDTFNFVDAQSQDGQPKKYEQLENEAARDDALVNRTYQYTFVTWQLTLDAEGKITHGYAVLGASEDAQTVFNTFLADDASIEYYQPTTKLTKNAQGQYTIGSAEALMNLNAYVESQESISERLDIILTNNIDLTGIDFSSWATMTKKFDGSIDGNGKVVYGMSGIRNVYYDFILKTIFGSLNDQTTNSVKNITFLFPYGTLNSGAPYTKSVKKITLTNVLSVHINAKKQFDFLNYYQATTGGNQTVGTTSTPVIEDTRLSEYGISSLQQLFAEKLGAEIWNGLIA